MMRPRPAPAARRAARPVEPLEARRLLSAGDLDPTFGDGGKVTTDFLGSSKDQAVAMVVQDDGKVVVGGTPAYRAETSWDFGLVRYNDDGSLDASFGDGGRVVTDFGRRPDWLEALAIQADGRIVAAGSQYDPTLAGGRGKFVFLVARYNTDGTLDRSFGDGGKTTIDFAPAAQAPSQAYAVAVDRGGRILVGGVADSAFAVARLTASGAPDRTFGDGGRVTTRIRPPSVPFGNWSNITAIDFDGRDNIVVAGPTGSDFFPTSSFAVARYDPAGRLDPAFNEVGWLEAGLAGSNLDVRMAVAPDDGVIVGTTTADYTPGRGFGDKDFALVRFSADGRDGTTVATDFAGGDDVLYALRVLDDGRVLAAGSASRGGEDASTDFAVGRYGGDFTLDPSFGDGGKVFTDFAGSADAARAAALDPAGRLVVAGTAVVPGRAEDFAVARYDFPPVPHPRNLVGRYVFYAGSEFAAGSSLDGPGNDDAIATDKVPFLDGQRPAFENVTTYARGLNGFMVDIRDLPPESFGPGDWAKFFRLEVSADPGAARWAPSPVSPRVAVRPEQGFRGSARVVAQFPDGALTNTWLRVTVLANVHTGLTSPGSFSFGNLVGDTGDAAAPPLRVGAVDLASVRRELNRSATVTDPLDFNRDGRVNALDLAAVRANLNRSLTATFVPAPPAAAALPRATRVADDVL